MAAPTHIEPQPTNWGVGVFAIETVAGPLMGGSVPRPPRRGAGPPVIFDGAIRSCAVMALVALQVRARPAGWAW